MLTVHEGRRVSTVGVSFNHQVSSICLNASKHTRVVFSPSQGHTGSRFSVAITSGHAYKT